MDPILAIFLIVAISIVVGVCAFLAGVQYRKKVGEDKIGSAETEAKRIIEEAQRSAESTKKKPSSPARTRLTDCSTMQNMRSPTAEKKCSVRKDVSSKKKNLSRKNSTASRKRTKP